MFANVRFSTRLGSWFVPVSCPMSGWIPWTRKRRRSTGACAPVFWMAAERLLKGRIRALKSLGSYHPAIKSRRCKRIGMLSSRSQERRSRSWLMWRAPRRCVRRKRLGPRCPSWKQLWTGGKPSPHPCYMPTQHFHRADLSSISLLLSEANRKPFANLQSNAVWPTAVTTGRPEKPC